MYVGRRPIESEKAAKMPGVRPWNIILAQLGPLVSWEIYYIVIERFIRERVVCMSIVMSRIAGK